MFGFRGWGWVILLWVVLGSFSGFGDGLGFRLDGLGVASGFVVLGVLGWDLGISSVVRISLILSFSRQFGDG